MAWFGTATSILGSFLVALGVSFLGYCAFLMGSAAWMFVAWHKKDSPLFLLNSVFFAANIIGLTRSVL